MENIILVSTNTYFCKNCECNQAVQLLLFLKGEILTQNTRDVQVFVEGKWLSALVHMLIDQFL